MPKKDVLEELSNTLTEKERITLLERINRTLEVKTAGDLPEGDERKKKEREILIDNELKQIGWFRKFLMLITGKLTGKKLGDILIDRKMNQLKKTINRKQPGLTGFESRNLTPLFAEKVFDLYSHTFAFRDLYRKLWLEPGVYESCCLYIVRAMYDNTRAALEDFISMEELVDLYASSGKKDVIIEEVDTRINDYIEEIPADIYEEIEKGMVPVYNLKDLILFPYTAFFQKFSFTPKRSEGPGKHFFKNASAMLCLDELKTLYVAVMTASMLDDNTFINKYMIEFIKGLGDSDELPENEQEELSRLINRVKLFSRSIPMLELIRFFKKDPFLQISYSFDKKSFKSTYQSILRTDMRSKINTKYSEIQREYIEKEIERIFKGKDFIEFRNYRRYSSIDYQKMGLPIFNHTKSLNLLYNYIKCFYQSHFSDLISILEKGILSQNRITRDRLLTHSISLQELEEKISASDKSLSPEEEDGKLFHKIRMTLASEPAQQRMFRALVVRKNKEVKSLIEWGEEALGGLEKIFEELIDTSSTTIKVQLNKHYLMKGKSITLVSLIKKRADHIKEFRRLLSQVLKIESD